MGGLLVRCLGSLQISVDGRPLALTGRRPRILLVVLALTAGRTVPVERLISALWCDVELPADPRSSLQSQVFRLRARLGADLVETSTAGYRLAIDPADVDAVRFLRLLTDVGAADAQTLDEAISLWRGTPFADLAAPWLERFERPQLVERYLAAVERRADLALASGDPANQLLQLGRVAAEHPLREPLQARLLLTLDRAGRTAEALQRYEELRVELAEALGTSPGAELQDIHTQLLRRTTVSSADKPVPSLQKQPPARQLPAAVGHFVGRTEELERLDALLPTGPTEGAALSTISGPAGVGKTTLALHWAHRVAERFPDGQLYVNLGGFDPAGRVMDSAEALRLLLDALGMPPSRIPSDPETQAALYRSVLAGRRILVLLDNARDTGQVRPLLPGSAGCLTVVTSRNQLFGLVATEGSSVVTVDLLSSDEARQLLASRIGSRRVEAARGATDEIIESCARLPLALAIAAARVVTSPDLPLTALATELRETHSRLDALSGDDPATDVRAVFSWSYRTLSADAARLFRWLSLHPGPTMSASAAASIAMVPLSRTTALLGELTRAQLIVADGDGRYSFHDLLRTYAADLARTTDAPEQRAAGKRRILDWYVRTAHQAAHLLSPDREMPALPATDAEIVPEPLRDGEAALDWLAVERPGLRVVLDLAAADELDIHVFTIAWSITDFLNRQGYWHDLATTSQRGLVAAVRLGDRVAQAQSHRGLAYALIGLNRLAEADSHLREALDLRAKIDDPAGIAHVHNLRCRVLALQNDHEGALRQAQLAHHFFHLAGNRSGESTALNNIGWYQALLGRYREAFTSVRRAYRYFARCGSIADQSGPLDSLGYILHQLGHFHFAAGCYQQALDIQKRFGQRVAQALTLDNLADTHLAIGDRDSAVAARREALTILEEIGHPEADRVRMKLLALHPAAQ